MDSRLRRDRSHQRRDPGTGRSGRCAAVGGRGREQQARIQATTQIGAAATTQISAASRVQAVSAQSKLQVAKTQVARSADSTSPGGLAHLAAAPWRRLRSSCLQGCATGDFALADLRLRELLFPPMTAVRIDGKELALKVRAEVAEDVRAFGQPVCLATILVGDDPASHVYVGSKHKASHEAGIDSRDHRYPSSTAQSEILDLIAELNADDAVDGILVQLPLPEHMDEPTVLRAVDPAKDVDGFHVQNAGLLYLGEPFLVPATPSGVMVMLAEHGVELKGRRRSSSAAARSSAS